MTYFLQYLIQNWSFIFFTFSMRPARSFFKSHAARESVWVWDPCSKRTGEGLMDFVKTACFSTLKHNIKFVWRHLWITKSSHSSQTKQGKWITIQCTPKNSIRFFSTQFFLICYPQMVTLKAFWCRWLLPFCENICNSLMMLEIILTGEFV